MSTTINLNQKEINVLHKTIETFLGTATANEFEMSFGYYTPSSFCPSFDMESFARLFEYLKTIAPAPVPLEWYEAPDPKGMCKHLLLPNANGPWMHQVKNKKTLTTLDYKVFDFRLKLNEEDVMEQGPVESHSRFFGQLGVPCYFKRKRWTFVLPEGIKFDLTVLDRIMYSQFSLSDQEIDEIEDKYKDMKFNVEVEFLKSPAVTIQSTYNSIINVAQETIKLLGGSSPYLTTSATRRLVLNYIKDKGMNQQGAQATNLEMDDFGMLNKYFMTPKVDGTRHFLVILESGQCYLYQPSTKNVITTNLCVHKFSDCILEVELIKDRFVCLFDLLRLKRDLRDLKDIQLFHRLNTIKEIEMSIKANNSPNEYFVVFMKQFYGQSVGAGLDTMKQDGNLATLPQDGLMFVSAFDCYPKKNGPTKVFMKWKSSYTIDLLYSTDDQGITSFLASHDSPSGLTVIEEEWTRFLAYYPWLVSGTVIEFELMGEARIKPIRIRYDKVFPNSIKTIQSNQERQSNPIVIESLGAQALYGFKTSDAPDNQHLDKIRQYNNVVKRNGINQMIKLVKVSQIKLLDLACGRLGDLSKWKKQNDVIALVTAIDKDQGFMSEAAKRLKETGGPMKNKVTILDHDLRAPMDQLNVEVHDVATVNFAIHFFLETEDTFKIFMKNVLDHLSPNGYLMFTCVDGDKLKETMGDKRTLSLCRGLAKFIVPEELGSAEAIDAQQVSSIFGNGLVATFGDVTSQTMLGERDQSHEFFVPLKNFVAYVCDNFGFEVATLQPFEKVSEDMFEELPIECQEFIQLNTMVILKRVVTPPSPPVNQVCDITESIEQLNIQEEIHVSAPEPEPMEQVDQAEPMEEVSTVPEATKVGEPMEEVSTIPEESIEEDVLTNTVTKKPKEIKKPKEPKKPKKSKETKETKKSKKDSTEKDGKVSIKKPAQLVSSATEVDEDATPPIEQQESQVVEEAQEAQEKMEEPEASTSTLESTANDKLEKTKAKLKATYKAVKDKRASIKLIGDNGREAITKEELNKMTVVQLKEYLKKNGMKTSAKKKAEIIEFILEGSE